MIRAFDSDKFRRKGSYYSAGFQSGEKRIKQMWSVVVTTHIKSNTLTDTLIGIVSIETIFNERLNSGDNKFVKL